MSFLGYNALDVTRRDFLANATLRSDLFADIALSHTRLTEAKSTFDLAMEAEIRTGLFERFASHDLRVQDQIEFNFRKAHFFEQLEQARKTAELAGNFALPNVLEAFRTEQEFFAIKLLHVQHTQWWNAEQHLPIFTQVSALSDMLTESTRVDRALYEASQAIALAGMPPLATLAEHRSFLDAAGLWLRRWPRIRLLSAAERRRQLKARLRANAEPPHVRKAKSLVHRYELVLREILDMVMTETFGDDWAERRLPLCECKDLLGKWRARGGDVLDHADYTHYARIISHPEHFEAIFAAGFDDRDGAYHLFARAGRLRARSHHPHPFTPDDLRDLRITWRTIEAGLVGLIPAHTVEF